MNEAKMEMCANPAGGDGMLEPAGMTKIKSAGSSGFKCATKLERLQQESQPKK
jgi:hypothetical protein